MQDKRCGYVGANESSKSTLSGVSEMDNQDKAQKNLLVYSKIERQGSKVKHNHVSAPPSTTALTFCSISGVRSILRTHAFQKQSMSRQWLALIDFLWRETAPGNGLRDWSGTIHNPAETVDFLTRSASNMLHL